MDFLISKKSLNDFLSNIVVPMSFFGLGSVKDILQLKLWQIYALQNTLKDEDLMELYKTLHGLNNKNK